MQGRIKPRTKRVVKLGLITQDCQASTSAGLEPQPRAAPAAELDKNTVTVDTIRH